MSWQCKSLPWIYSYLQSHGRESSPVKDLYILDYTFYFLKIHAGVSCDIPNIHNSWKNIHIRTINCLWSHFSASEYFTIFPLFPISVVIELQYQTDKNVTFHLFIKKIKTLGLKNGDSKNWLVPYKFYMQCNKVVLDFVDTWPR